MVGCAYAKTRESGGALYKNRLNSGLVIAYDAVFTAFFASWWGRALVLITGIQKNNKFRAFCI